MNMNFSHGVMYERLKMFPLIKIKDTYYFFRTKNFCVKSLSNKK